MSVCILCDNEIENVDQVIAGLKGLWETILTGLFHEIPKQTLDNQLICDRCYDGITRLKTFKTRCQTIENEIIAYKKTHNTDVVKLKDIRQDAGQDLQEDARLCRTCLRKVDDRNWEKFGQENPHFSSFATFNIKLSIDMVPNPIICHYCTENLHKLSKIRRKCLQLVSEHKTETTPLEPPFASVSEHIANDPAEIRDLPVMANIDNTDEDSPQPFVETTEFFIDLAMVNNDDLVSTTSNDLISRIEESCVVVGGTKVFQCMYCDYTAARKGNLKVHVECRHEQAPVLFTCGQCDYMAPRKIQLSRHIRMRHRQGSGEVLRCRQCDFSTTIIEYLRKHTVKHREDAFACPHCSFSSKWKSNLKKHVRRRHEKETKDCVSVSKCPHCEYSTANRRSYRRHVMTKHMREEDKYQCEKCDFKTSNKDYMKRHVRMKHDDTLTVYTCEVCNKYKTKRMAQLQRHKEVMHEKKEELEGNIYECSKCPFTTVRKQLLAYHLRMHDAKRIYKCDECSYDTKFRCNLRSHVLHKHRKVSAKCPHCDYEAKWQVSLRKHIESKHSDKEKVLYECAQCENYKVSHKRTLIRHIKSKHSPSSPTLKCKLCDFRTNLSEYLRKHVSNMHNNTSAFQCRHCPFNTKGKHILKKHLRVRHSIDDMQEKTDFDKVEVENKRANRLSTRNAGLDFKFVGLQEQCDDLKRFEEVFVKIERLVEADSG